jgi:HSP20 family protein
MTTLLTRDARAQAPVQTPVLEPFRMMRDLLRWDPFRESAWIPEAPAAFLPGFDIRETPSAYVFKADLPGVRLEDLDIQVLGNRLSIQGKRPAEVREEKETWHLSERSFGVFSRSFTLPEDINAAQVEARLDQGVLTLTVAKSPSAQPQRIQVQGN